MTPPIDELYERLDRLTSSEVEIDRYRQPSGYLSFMRQLSVEGRGT